MVNFAQQLQAELVPEWQEAYCSYADLKGDIRRVKQHNRGLGPGIRYARSGSVGLMKSLTSFKPALTGAISRHVHDHTATTPRGASKEVIQISKCRTDDGDVYITALREPLSRSAQDKTFFARLDAQLTKVNKFYRKKEGEYIARAAILERQMRALLCVQEDIARQGIVPLDYLTTGKANHLADLKDTDPHTPLISEEKRQARDYPMQTFLMQPSAALRNDNNALKDDDEIEDEEEEEDADRTRIGSTAATNLKQRRANFADVDLELAIPERGGHHVVRFSPGTTPDPAGAGARATRAGSGLPATPRPALKKNVSRVPEEEETKVEIETAGTGTAAVAVDVVVDVAEAGGDGDEDVESAKQTARTKKELSRDRNQLRLAFVEFYRGLGLLSNFRALNMMAFAKILKKYDKNTGWYFTPIYMKEVESSYFATSTKVHKLMNKVEDIFIKHFSDGVRKKAMSQLRPMRTQGTHRTTFFIGLFTGCSMALFTSFLFLVESKKSLSHGGRSPTQYLETVFPVFSTLMLIVLHVFCYAGNVYSWSKTRVNYPFIFGFSPGTELRYRQVLLLATGLTTCLLGGMNIHIGVTLLTVEDVPAEDVPAESSSLASEPYHADVVPLFLVVLTLATLFLPFNLMYRSSRAFFLGCLRRLVFAPFVKVILPDFFLGDQLTSQVLVFRNLEFMACFYPTGFFLDGADTKCDLNPIYRGFGYVAALLPFWWRFLQCLRRYYDEKDTHHLENAGKYFSAIVALGLRQAFLNHSQLKVLWILSIIASVIATIYGTYWDLCVDWGLLHRHSKNKWLRDKIILKNKSIYFIAIGVNCVLRLVWMLAILRVDRTVGWNANAFNVTTAAVEILRRGLWNYFRVENEHLNNVGKYRAVKAVPLPFNDD